MQFKNLLQLGIAGGACAIALLASDFWKTKDSSQWSTEEVNKLLTDSPWSKEITVIPNRSGAGQRRSSGNGTGRRGGIGFPGGGVGFPGGGYPGGGYPGGGGGYPRGGGYPGGGGYPDDTGNYPGGGRAEAINVTLRWESALPVQQALMRQGGLGAEESKTAANAASKDYVISVTGLRMPQGRNRLDDNDNDKDPDRNSTDKDRLRSQFLDAAQIIPKGKRSIYAEDVQFEGPNGSSAVRFLFPKASAISAGDKEVDFKLEIRGIKVEHKFRLADMQYQGQLAL